MSDPFSSPVLDLNTGGVTPGLVEKLLAPLHSMRDSLSRLERSWIQRASDVPRDAFFSLSAVIPNSTTAVTLTSPDIGGLGPQQGQVWLLRRIAIGGVGQATAVAGSAVIYQQGSDPNYPVAGAGGWANVVGNFAALPAVQEYSNRQIILRYPDNLFISVLGPTVANQQVQANVAVEIYNEGGYKAELTL